MREGYLRRLTTGKATDMEKNVAIKSFMKSMTTSVLVNEKTLHPPTFRFYGHMWCMIGVELLTRYLIYKL